MHYHYYHANCEYKAQYIYVQQKKSCYVAFYYCVKPLKVSNIQEEISTFVDLVEYFDLRPKHQVYLSRGQQCVWFYQKWLCISQHKINGSHLVIGS